MTKVTPVKRLDPLKEGVVFSFCQQPNNNLPEVETIRMCTYQVILQMILLICLVAKSLQQLRQVVNHELKLVIKQLRLNKLSLNAGKTELIFFSFEKVQWCKINSC